MKFHKVCLWLLILFLSCLCLLILGLLFSIVNSPNNTRKIVKQAAHTISQTLSPIKDIIPSNERIKKLDLLKYAPRTKKKYTCDLLFYLKSIHNFQALTFYNKYFYCGFDVGAGKAQIVKYNIEGRKISKTKSINVGHCASIGYRISTGKIYIVNGGGHKLTHIYIVDYNTSLILSNLNYERLGTSALLAIDNIHDYLILHTILHRGDAGIPKFTIINLNNMKIISSFNVANEGIPQGLVTDGKHIYLYTNNKITVFNYKGAIIAKYYLNKRGESEGMTIASIYKTSYLAIGYNHPNRIYGIK